MVILLGVFRDIENPIQGVKSLLLDASLAWHINGTWTAVIVWVLWWPAWILGASSACGPLLEAVRFVGQGVRVGEVDVRNR